MRKISILLILLIQLFNIRLSADEGMWIPLLIEKFNIDDMQEKGFKLSAEDIYSINKACLLDAVVIFGGGCTGEIVSNQGLLLTNHHCGYSAIQKQSSIEHDYLTNGFWAMSKEEELPNPDLNVSFLKRIEDVTDKVLANVNDDLTEDERIDMIKNNINIIKDEVRANTDLSVSIKPFFYGNQYYLFEYEVFKDIRLVGAPPSAIGKFGGDTDNWAWPRHTGDFSIFRVYANKDNKPAEYSPDNVPYKPKKFLPISIKPLNEGDFTMVLGYPGSTTQYVTSDDISLIQNIRNPKRVECRDKRLEIMNRFMEVNDTIRIKYASKNYGVSNSWKRWKGEIIGLERLNVVENKRIQEKEFNNWAQGNNKKEYIGLIDKFSGLYKEFTEFATTYDYWRESILAVEIIRFASRFEKIIGLAEADADKDFIRKEYESLDKELNSFFKDYAQVIDQEVFNELIPLYYANVDAKYQPEIEGFDVNKDLDKYISNLFKNTVFNKKDELVKILKKGKKQKIAELAKDPIYAFYKNFADIYNNKVKDKYTSLQDEINTLYRLYLKGLREMKPDKVLYPDANFTMRVSYGNVKGSYPKDGIKYLYYTTIDGVIEKDNPAIYDYDVPGKLKELYKAKDYGEYAVNETVPVCFIATNHTTGGNSGSPVLDAEGNLIGLNFDRVWEGIMSDMQFDPKQSRNITLDIRYLLFIVDKFAGAGHLIDEMTIVK